MTGNPRIQWMNLQGVLDGPVLGAAFELLKDLAEGLIPVVEEREYGAASHSMETAVISKMIGERLGFCREKLDILYLAGLVHDIGKVAVPESILNKTEPLNRLEQDTLERHPVVGAAILTPVAARAGVDEVVDIVLHHHERFDGTGYPHKLEGDSIPPGARIVGAADAVSGNLRAGLGMCGMCFCESVEEVKKGAGTDFDPRVVDAVWAIRRQICSALWTLRTGRKKHDHGKAC